MVGIFTFINILNYLDRGIVPVSDSVLGAALANFAADGALGPNPPVSLLQGAFESIGDFIREDLRTNNTDVEQGLLQSE